MGDDTRELSRRAFIKTGLLGGAGAAACLGGWPDLVSAATSGSSGYPAPVYRTLGRTGLKITRGQLRGHADPGAGGHPGRPRPGGQLHRHGPPLHGRQNEEIVAKAIKGLRDKLYLATKTLGQLKHQGRHHPGCGKEPARPSRPITSMSSSSTISPAEEGPLSPKAREALVRLHRSRARFVSSA